MTQNYFAKCPHYRRPNSFFKFRMTQFDNFLRSISYESCAILEKATKNKYIIQRKLEIALLY